MSNSTARINSDAAALKSAIINGIVDINELDTERIDALIRHETDLLSKGNGNIKFIELCADALSTRRVLCTDTVPPPSVFVELNDESSALSTLKGAWSRLLPTKTFWRRAVACVASVILLLSAHIFPLHTDAFFKEEYIYRYYSTKPLSEQETAFDTIAYSLKYSRNYDSIEALVKGERLDILYPTVFPEGFYVRWCTLFNDHREENFSISTQLPNVYFGVRLGVNSAKIDPGDREIFVVGSAEFIIFEEAYYLGEPSTYAFCQYKGDDYCIGALNREDLMIILNSIKEN